MKITTMLTAKCEKEEEEKKKELRKKRKKTWLLIRKKMRFIIHVFKDEREK